jgi:uncharacterized protein with HEPN domain
MRVEDILACIAKILQYSDGMTFEVFCADSKTVDAVIRNFEIIGEAASHIPEEIQERYPGLAWLEMRGMRNIMCMNTLVSACRSSGALSPKTWSH